LREIERFDEETDELFFRQVAAHVVGNMMTLLLLTVGFFVFYLFETYTWPITWAVLAGASLHPFKASAIQKIKAIEQIDGSSFGFKAFTSVVVCSTSTSVAGVSMHLTSDMAASMLVGIASGVLPLLIFYIPLHFSTHKLLLYRYLLDDNTLVTIIIVLFMVLVAVSVLVFFTAACGRDGVAAIHQVSTWVDQAMSEASSGSVAGVNITNHTDKVRMMAIDYVKEYEASFNGTVYGRALQTFGEHLQAKQENFHPMKVIEDSLAEVLGKNFTVASIATFVYDNVANTTSLQETAVQAATKSTGIFKDVLLQVLMVIISLMDVGLQAVLFMTVLYYLLSNERSVLRIFVYDVVPVPEVMKHSIFEACRETIFVILMLPFKMAFFHSIFVFVVFSCLGSPFKYFATALVALFTVVPVFPAGFVPLPWAMSAAFRGDYFIAGFYGFGVNYLMGYIDWCLYEGQLDGKVHPYVTALSVGLGYSTFGVKGLLIGPLIICGAVVLMNLMNDYRVESKNEAHARLRVSRERRKNEDLGSSTLES